MAVIEARELTKSYGPTLAVADLSFTVRPGRVTGFLGPNGSGKSTTMRLMLGLDHGSGTATFDGAPFVTIKHPMRSVGALLEAQPFHPTRSAHNHLRMLASANGIPTSRIAEALHMVGLTEVARRGPRTFSLGMAQRLGLAGALLGDPPTLILDEPSNGLDPQGINWLRELLKALAAEGRTIFVSSHLLSEMALMADDLVIIGRGRLIGAGPVREFLRTSGRTHVLLTSPDVNRLAPALRDAGASVELVTETELRITGLDQAAIGDKAFEVGARLHGLSTREATLEEAFLEATAGSQQFLAHDFGLAEPPTTALPGGWGTQVGETR